MEGYDTSLPPDEIKKALTHHFSSCGKLDRVIVVDRFVCLYVTLCFFPDSSQVKNVFLFIFFNRCAHVEVFGEHLEEKTSELDGSDLGGFKLVVKPFPRLVYEDAPFGSQVHKFILDS